MCLSAAGRQPSPDSKVVEIVVGAETKDDFGPVPPDEGRGSQRSLFRVVFTVLYTDSSQLCAMADQKIKPAVVHRIKPDLLQDIMGGAPIA